MQDYARVVGGVVAELIESFTDPDGITVPIEERFAPEIVATLVPVPTGLAVQSGWVYDGVTFSAPASPADEIAPPRIVTRRQGRRALLAAGLLDAVPQIIASLPESQRREAEIDWEDATEFDRDSPLLQRLAPALGLDDAKLDALFSDAATY